MMNTKKSRKSMIVLSVIAAFILCSFATVYAFATNTIEQGVKTPIDDINLKETPKDSDITIASEPIYPVDLEYFKDWEGWETEWEKFLEEYEKRWSQSHVDITKTIDLLKSPEYWNICPWKLIVKNTEGVMFQLKNGTEIETDGSFLTKQDKYLINLTKVFTSIEKEDPELLKNIPEHLKSLTLKPSSSIALMIPNHKSIIRLANGITIETSEYTLITVKLIANADHELEIIVGANEATITQPDGTSTTVPAGTILDGEGNVI